HGRPDPVRRALQALHRLVLADRTGFEVSQYRVQLIELPLLHMQAAEERGGKGLQLLCRFDQPVQDRVRLDLKDAGGGANAQPLRQAGQHVDDQLYRPLLAMKDGAVSLQKVPFARGTLQLAPPTAPALAVGPHVAPPQPATLPTA